MYSVHLCIVFLEDWWLDWVCMCVCVGVGGVRVCTCGGVCVCVLYVCVCMVCVCMVCVCAVCVSVCVCVEMCVRVPPLEQGWIAAHVWTGSHQQPGCCCDRSHRHGNGLLRSSGRL